MTAAVHFFANEAEARACAAHLQQRSDCLRAALFRQIDGEAHDPGLIILIADHADPLPVPAMRSLILDHQPCGDPVKGGISLDAPPMRAPTRLGCVAILPLHAELLCEAIGILAGEFDLTHAEPGLHRFAMFVQSDVPATMVVLEAWRDGADWLAHQDTHYFQETMAALPATMREGMEVFMLEPIATNGAIGDL